MFRSCVLSQTGTTWGVVAGGSERRLVPVGIFLRIKDQLQPIKGEVRWPPSQIERRSPRSCKVSEEQVET